MKKILTGGVLLVLVLLSVTACAVKPEKVLTKMMRAMAKIDSFQLSLNVGVNGQFPNIQNLNDSALAPGTLILKVNGPVNLENDLAYDFLVDIKQRSGDTETYLKGGLRYLVETLYFSLTEVPQIQMADLESLKNNWYKLDFAELGLNKDISKQQKKLDLKKSNKLRDLAAKTDFFNIEQNFGLEDLDGQTVYHFQIKINEDGLREFMQKATEIMEERDLTSEEIQDMEKTITSLAQVRGELWIGQKDYRIYKGEFSWFDQTGDNGDVKYDIALNLSQYNEKFEISKPENVRDFNLAELLLPDINSNASDVNKLEQSIDMEEYLKQIDGVDPVELEKQLEDLQKQMQDIDN